MPRTSTTTLVATQRLPVNPRRHRVAPDKRKRVATACNNCNIRRIKCSGERPCKQCSGASRECQYPVAVDKITVPRSELEELRARCASLERCLQDAIPDASQRQLLLSRAASVAVTTGASLLGAAPLGDGSPTGSSRGTLSVVDEEPPPSDGRLLQDFDGTARYLGETSGATFLDNLKQFMSTIFPLAFNGASPDPADPGAAFIWSVGRYQTYDSRPLLTPAVDPLWLPSREDMADRLAQLRYFQQEDGGVTGGMIYLGNLVDIPDGPGTDSTLDLQHYRGLAFYHAAFAYSELFNLTTPGCKQDGHLGEAFFARARTLLGDPLDITLYTTNDIIVLALMGLYPIEMNRRDASYLYITTALHVAIMHGIHRGWSVDERGKRIFWTVYVLDRWISCLMGRPPAILDDDINLDLPRDVPGLPPSVGLRANVELSKIAGHIVCNTHRVSSWADANQRTVCHIDKALQMLGSWIQDLPAELRISYDDFSQDRPLCVLHMTYNQLLILTIRPILFVAVKRAVADRFVSRQWSIEQHPQIEHIRECSDAARRNLRLARWVQKTSPRQKLLLPDLHHIFNAAIILLLHQIVFVNLRTNDVSDIAYAIEVFEREASFDDNYGRDCAKVLQDLLAIVQRLRSLMFDGMSHARTSPPMAHAGLPMTPPPVPVTTSMLGAYGLLSHSELPVTTTGYLPSHIQGSGHPVYQELVTWLDNSEMQQYFQYVV